jgi:hypothetical protein
MSKWLSVVVLVMLVLVAAMGLRGIVTARGQAPVQLALAGGPVPPIPPAAHLAGGPVPPIPPAAHLAGGPVPPIPPAAWRLAGGPVPPIPPASWSK